LPYKIEIKRGPSLEKDTWFLFFVLPESETLEEVQAGNLD